MPELPETETIAADLREQVAGSEVLSFRAPRKDVLRGPSPIAIARRLKGKLLENVWRRAKTIVLELSSGDRLLVQPRFTGVLTVEPASQLGVAPYLCAALFLTEGRAVAYRDVRRLGTVCLVNQMEFNRFTASLGDEPLDPGFTSDRLSVLLRGSRSPVKSTLMDQHRIAGVGNIYANEALWRAGIDPSRPAMSLASAEVSALHSGLQSVLKEAVAARGTSFRDYRDGRGERGQFAAQLQAYGRGGRPCARCASALVQTHAIDGRSTVFCYRCQC